MRHFNVVSFQRAMRSDPAAQAGSLFYVDRIWLGVGRKCDVPRTACYVGRCGDVYVWVAPENLDHLSRFTLAVLDMATQKTEQEEKRAKEKPPENVEEVWKRGYADGMQLTWLFLGLARAAGFEAYGCWVSGRREYFFSPVTMQSAKLDSNVVLVKMNGKDLYFDPGGAFTPFGLLEWSETGVQGLRLDKDGGTWIQTTLPNAAESRIERVAKMKLSDTGDLEGTLTVTYVGLEAMYHRLGERNADEVARKKFLEERLTSQIGVAAEAELTNKPDWASSETPLVAEFNLKIPGWASNAGRRVVLPAAIFTAAEKGVFEHASRVQLGSYAPQGSR